ncbi:hypothetical protein C9374_006560 [Naegleria lovaniensis]|uniref:DUF4252 domain-containing protein n=1 Tax=Naegleria lovaniensis TaxID=51637 RepID=A0AA88GIY7_NAELO|nr:uncharacterized protein C9374_006560 [Naegleria lovaniensis]KAG2379443.1 hypothetical protein C9374_006560 [Naegleria lovaniensis]
MKKLVVLILLFVLATWMVGVLAVDEDHDEKLSSEFAAAFAKYSDIEKASSLMHSDFVKIQSSSPTDTVSSSSSHTNHFVLKTRMENDEFVKSIAHKYGLTFVRKIPSSDGSVNYILRGVGVMDESYGLSNHNMDTVQAMSGKSALLTAQTIQNIVKKNSDTVLEFYRAKKQNFSKR